MTNEGLQKKLKREERNEKIKSVIIFLLVFGQAIVVALYGAYKIIWPEKPKSGLLAQEVYLCMGPQAECYHTTRQCSGLKNCSEYITKVTLEEAKQCGRMPCSLCSWRLSTK